MEDEYKVSQPLIPPYIIYQSIRQEILDQKLCQFKLFSVALTLTVAVIAYAGATKLISLIYIAPIVMNDLTMAILLHKAVSIQRMSGYLNLMERGKRRGAWMWEAHLDSYRCLTDVPKPRPEDIKEFRPQKAYVRPNGQFHAHLA